MGGNVRKSCAQNGKSKDTACKCTPAFIQSKAKRATTGGCHPYQQGVVIQSGCDDRGKSNVPFSVKLGGCSHGGNKVSLIPPVCTTPDGGQFTELSDPTKDIFILRIGRKSVGSEKKTQNLELELCNPNAPDIKPSPKLETKDTQWEDGGSSGAEAKNKGIKDKGKGKGKGKGKK